MVDFEDVAVTELAEEALFDEVVRNCISILIWVGKFRVSRLGAMHSLNKNRVVHQLDRSSCRPFKRVGS